MRFVFIPLFILLASFPSLANMKLKLTPEITLTLSQPNTIAHSLSSLLIRYDDGTMMHEHIDPERAFAPAINLTGIAPLFFRSLFEPETMQTLPDWLSALAKEQHAALGITLPVDNFLCGDVHVYHFFSKSYNTGHLFMISSNSVQRIEVTKDADLYQNLVNQLRTHHANCKRKT
ncbi:hypothetical protein [Photobacterium lutimaris]|uniref:Uncharacterized protein n=1 Tax=Photobacterium lutimaris TaxID=388278 RepID=A0A2T3IZG0_9GAMM|nr:hypothetical protein [Photobacterium lutimaris]PSU34050.1 hypothetical protein C9I99_11890 [Photobacterium lutimaris]TDR76395.1 hypothetical protein DFP78_103392 [Photobacterium lutimaris]